MQVLIADQDQVSELLPMNECIEVMEQAFRLASEGDVILPLRTMMVLPDHESLLGLMPSYLGGINSLGVKVIAAFPKNLGTEYDSHQGVILLFDAERGLLRAIVDATAVTAIRTAACSGVATRLLARNDAGDLAIIGAGTQARAHLEAMLCVRPVRRVRVFSVPHESAVAFSKRESARYGIDIEVASSAQAAVDGADIICTVTSSPKPVLQGAWLKTGAHINAVGAFTPVTRELDTEAVVRSRLYADRRESLKAESGEYLIPAGKGIIDESHIVGEIGQVLLGTAPGRTTPDEITLFKSLGIAIEDIASAHHIYKQAGETGTGTWIEIGGRHYGSA